MDTYSEVSRFVLERFEYAVTPNARMSVANRRHKGGCERVFGFEYEVVVTQTVCACESDSLLRLCGVSSSVVL